MGVKEINYFETRSETVLRKILLLITKVIIEDLVSKIKIPNVYSLLIDEVTDISNHGTIIWTGITCKKISCYIHDSACR